MRKLMISTAEKEEMNVCTLSEFKYFVINYSSYTHSYTLTHLLITSIYLLCSTSKRQDMTSSEWEKIGIVSTIEKGEGII